MKHIESQSVLRSRLEPVIEVDAGKIKGKICEDVRGEFFYCFLGIPYATPPIGDLRFRAPVPVDPWPEVFDATRNGNVSIQENHLKKKIDGSEDCLNLNVYTPNVGLAQKQNYENLPEANKNVLKPVMVYIHGGIYLSGSNSKEFLGPELLITEDVVIVTINYRLGILGFLSLKDPSLNVPGNAGLKDMVLALKWVQKNIHNFMGNRKNVTIFGNSAGAVSVHFLVLSPMGKGLFHKAICQSGSALSGWGYAYESTKPLARELGLENVKEKELYDYLRKASVEEIYKAQCKIDQETVKTNRLRPIGAVVEASSWKGERFFSEHPINILLSGRYNKVPLLIGYNTGDGMIVDGLVGPKRAHLYWTDKENNVPGLFYLEKGSPLSKHLGDEIVKFYFGNDNISRETHLQALYDITRDNVFLKGILLSIQHHLRTSNIPIYMYRLSIESELGFYKKMLNIKLPGVCHVDELGYIFTNILTKTPTPGSISDLTQKRMIRLWANFGKYGNPTPFVDPLLGTIWKPVTDTNHISFLDICEDLKMSCNPESEKIKFWDKIYANKSLTSKL